MKGSGTISAKRTDDGLEVGCSCGETFTLPSDGGERACACGVVHRYDGRTLRSAPRDRSDAPPGRGIGVGNPNLRPPPRDPRAWRPPRGESRPL